MTSRTDPAAARSLVVAVCTYRRNDDLAELLPLLGGQHGAGVDLRVLVIDNDPGAGACDLVERSAAGPPTRYVHEPRPGISAARNRALAESEEDLMVFLDDDERPGADWLACLVRTFDAYPCAGVAGRVRSVFDAPLDPWIEAGGFFDRVPRSTGDVVPVAATNNLLLDMAVVRRLGLRFDERFGLSGGSDTLFTAQLARAGERVVWCDEAVVDDVVPADRATRSWVVRRHVRSGNTESRVGLVLARGAGERRRWRARQTARGTVRMLAGVARELVGAVCSDVETGAKGRRNRARGWGMVVGAWGHVVVEYGRGSE